MKKLLSLAAVSLLFAACTPTPPADSDTTPPPTKVMDNGGAMDQYDNDMMDGDSMDEYEPMADEMMDGDPLEDEIVLITVSNTDTVDTLTISVGNEVTDIELPVSAEGETQVYEPKSGDDTIALFYNYWAGGGTLIRVRHTGLKLTVEAMNIDEPSPEYGVACDDWREISKVDIGLAQDFDVQPGEPKQEYQQNFDCDCQETADGTVCVNL